MTRKDALAELISKVEAGELGDYDGEALRLVRAWRSPLEYFEITRFVHTAYHGSLDAAKSLHEVVLPGWGYLISCQQWVDVWEFEPAGTGSPIRGVSQSPARAWLLAILKALHSMEKD